MASFTTTTDVLDKKIVELKDKNLDLQTQIWKIEEKIKDVMGIPSQIKEKIIKYKKKKIQGEINKRIELMNILREYYDLFSNAESTIDDLMTEHDYVTFYEQDGHEKILSSIE